MAEIINLADRRKKPIPSTNVEDIVSNAIEDISAHWEKFATNNRLNDYFLQYTPLRSKDDVNYLEDLTELGVLELRVRLHIQVTSPAFTEDAIGWIASFKVNGITVSTPPMRSEAYARAFNVLLFLKVKRDMVTAGIETV